jgi:putative oxidoreductase
MGKLLFGSSRIETIPANIGLLVVRGTTGLFLALGHGLAKLPPSDRLVETIAGLGYPVPAVFAWTTAMVEFAGGLLLAIGLMTRPASASIAITMLLIATTRHALDPFAVKEKALLFALIALAFMLIGAGKYSVDALIGRRKHSG